MNSIIPTIRQFISLLLLLMVAYTTIAQRTPNSGKKPATWEVIHIRGTIKSNNTKLSAGTRFNDADTIRFSQTSDIMAVMKVGQSPEAMLVRPFDFDMGPDSAYFCSAADCKAVWEPPMMMVGFNSSKIEEDEHGNITTSGASTVIMKPTTIALYWIGVENSSDNTLNNSISRLRTGDKLLPGNFLQSINKKYKLIYQTDGNLVLYRLSDKTICWQSGTTGNRGGYCEMLTNGNLAIYASSGKVVWSTGIRDKSARMQGNNFQGSQLSLLYNGNLQLGLRKQTRWETRTFEGSINSSTSGYDLPISQKKIRYPKPKTNYRILSAVDKKALQVGASKAGKRLYLATVRDFIGQQWLMNLQTNGFYTLQSKIGYSFMSVEDSTLQSQKASLSQGSKQKAGKSWDLIPTGDGLFYLRNDFGKYLEVVNGTHLMMNDFNGSTAQKWLFLE